MAKDGFQINLATELEHAISISKRAANSIMGDSFTTRSVRLDEGRDIKILADSISENAIFSMLVEEIKYGCQFLGEETGLQNIGDGSSDYCWIVDPLDGSLNFSRGIPLCAVSVALWKGSQPLIGVINDFLRGELFYGIAGQGAFINGEPMHASSVSQQSKAICCTGFPIATDFGQQRLLSFVTAVQEFKKVRLLGSAALSLAYVACGRVDYYVEKDIKIWDVAAGIALVAAAGGKYHTEKSTKEFCLTVHGTNGLLDFIKDHQ